MLVVDSLLQFNVIMNIDHLQVIIPVISQKILIGKVERLIQVFFELNSVTVIEEMISLYIIGVIISPDVDPVRFVDFIALGIPVIEFPEFYGSPP